MIQDIFDLLKEILRLEFFRRCIVILFLPNVLVWGFAEVGIDNKYNFFWSHFLNPYWEIETFLFKAIFYGGIVVTLYCFFALLIRSWLEHRVDSQEQMTSKFEYQNSDRDFPRPVPMEPQKTLSLAKPEQVAIHDSKLLSPEEIKRRALRDITGKGA